MIYFSDFGAGSGPTDPNFSNTVLLVGFDSVDGSGNYTDESFAAHGANDILGLTEPSLDTSVKKFGAGSALFNGTSNAMGWSNDTDFQFGSGQFTIEMWVRFDAAGIEAYQNIVERFVGGTNQRSWIFQYRGGDATNNLAFVYSTTGVNSILIQQNWTPTAGVWYHLAVDRDASDKFRIYVDGVMLGSPTTAAVTIFAGSASLRIGSASASGGSQWFRGNLDELRITKGVGRYASDGGFTAPTAAFPRN